ncbi:MAG: four helix bundle protein [bacterium]|nr:four helix bundle protein [bacterium]
MADVIKSHKDLVVWQKSVQLSIAIYKLTDDFPAREVYSLASQMRRAVVSIPSNIAEGKSRGTRKDFAHFLHMAYGSASELETQLLIAKQLKFCGDEKYIEANSLLTEVSKMLRVMIGKLETSN